jgi:hypothetical protein
VSLSVNIEYVFYVSNEVVVCTIVFLATCMATGNKQSKSRPLRLHESLTERTTRGRFASLSVKLFFHPDTMSSARKRVGGPSSTRKSATTPSTELTKSKKTTSKEQAGLRTLVQQRYLSDVFQFCAGKSYWMCWMC